MLIGYARVSTHDQTLNLQRDALEKAECEKIFTDQLTGTKAERKGLRACLVSDRVRLGGTKSASPLRRKQHPVDCFRGQLPHF
jgi:hypothetical protein